MGNTIFNKTYNDVADLIGRILIGGFFAYAGFGKILGFSGTAGWMASVGFPMAEFFLVLTIILELVGGIMLMLGIKVKEIAFLLTGFVILASIIFHSPFDPDQKLYFTKNMMIVGGLLILSSTKSTSFYLSK